MHYFFTSQVWRMDAYEGFTQEDLPESCCVKSEGKPVQKCHYKGFFTVRQLYVNKEIIPYNNHVPIVQEGTEGVRSSFSGDYNKNDKTYRDYNAEIYRTGCLAVLDHLYYTQVGAAVLYCTVLYCILYCR